MANYKRKKPRDSSVSAENRVKSVYGRYHGDDEFEAYEHNTAWRKHHRNNFYCWWDDYYDQSRYGTKSWKDQTRREKQWRPKELPRAEKREWHGRERKPLPRWGYRRNRRYKNAFCEKYGVEIIGGSCPFSDYQLRALGALVPYGYKVVVNSNRAEQLLQFACIYNDLLCGTYCRYDYWHGLKAWRYERL